MWTRLAQYVRPLVTSCDRRRIRPLIGKREIGFPDFPHGPWMVVNSESRVTKQGGPSGRVSAREGLTLMYLPYPKYKFCNWALRAQGLQGHPS